MTLSAEPGITWLGHVADIRTGSARRDRGAVNLASVGAPNGGVRPADRRSRHAGLPSSPGRDWVACAAARCCPAGGGGRGIADPLARRSDGPAAPLVERGFAEAVIAERRSRLPCQAVKEALVVGSGSRLPALAVFARCWPAR